MSRMRISQLATRTGVPATTLRFYESAGLLPAERTPAGYRIYAEEAVERLAFIGAAKHLGLPLEQIADLVTVWESGACAEVKAELRPRIAARLAEAEQRAAELAAFTASLRATLEHLDALPDRAERCDARCGVPTTSGPLPADGGGPVKVTLAPNRQAAEREAEQTAEREAEQAGERWRTAPVACSLTGQAMTERVAAWHRTLADARRSGIPGGVRLTLPAERTAAVAELAVAEQGCCAFFDFRLHLAGPHLHVEVRAPAEGAGLLAELFGPAA